MKFACIQASRLGISELANDPIDARRSIHRERDALKLKDRSCVIRGLGALLDDAPRDSEPRGPDRVRLNPDIGHEPRLTAAATTTIEIALRASVAIRAYGCLLARGG